MDYPGFFLKFSKIADNIPLFGETLFWTIIVATNAPFAESFAPPPDGLFCSEIRSVPIRDYLPQKGNFRIQMDYPGFPLNFGKSWAIFHGFAMPYFEL